MATLEVMIEATGLLTNGQMKSLEGPIMHAGGPSMVAALSHPPMAKASQLSPSVASQMPLTVES